MLRTTNVSSQIGQECRTAVNRDIRRVLTMLGRSAGRAALKRDRCSYYSYGFKFRYFNHICSPYWPKQNQVISISPTESDLCYDQSSVCD